LKTFTSLGLDRRSLCALACTLVMAGCGGGQLAGQASTDATQASTPTVKPPVTTTTPPTRTRTTPRHAPRRPSTTPTQPAATQTTPPTTTTAPPPSGPTTHAVDEQASVTLVKTLGQLHYLQRGRVGGTFDGEMTLETKPGARGGIVTFSVDVDGGGTVSGRGVVTPNLSAGGGKLKPITGTAAITGGTGPFAGISGHGLIVTGKAALDGSAGSVRLTGVVKY
jgi:hypothetical protein